MLPNSPAGARQPTAQDRGQIADYETRMAEQAKAQALSRLTDAAYENGFRDGLVRCAQVVNRARSAVRLWTILAVLLLLALVLLALAGCTSLERLRCL
jgi:hypothetical protein